MTTIRNMKPEDVPQVAEMESRTFSQPWSAKGFLDSLQLPNTIFLAACEGEKIVGYAGMYLSVEEGEIVNVAVAQNARRRGIGDALLNEMAKCAAKKGVQRIVLEVRVSNEPAIHLYEKHGYVRCGVRKGFYELPKEDAYIMIYGQ